MNLTNHDIELWRSLYMQNYNEFGYEGIKGHIKTTVDWLESNGFLLMHKNK